MSREQKDILRWLFTPPQSSGLSDEPTLKAMMPGESLVEIGPRYINTVSITEMYRCNVSNMSAVIRVVAAQMPQSSV